MTISEEIRAGMKRDSKGHCERSEYVYILEDKSSLKNAKNGPMWRVFENLTYGQTELPDRAVLIGQKLEKNAKIEIFKCDILGDFQTLCRRRG